MHPDLITIIVGFCELVIAAGVVTVACWIDDILDWLLG